MALQEMRSKLGDGAPRQLFAELSNNPIFGAAVASHRAPRKFSDIWVGKRLSSRGFNADLAWLGEVVAIFASEIRGFLQIEREFDSAYITGDLVKCVGLLDRLQESHGLSLWLISRKTTILRMAGVHQDVDYTSSLIAGDRNNSVISWLVYFMGYRDDPNVTPTAYLRQLKESLDPSKVPDPIKSYIRYHANNLTPRNLTDYAAILAVSETSPLIDRYIVLIDTLQFIACGTRVDSGEHTAAKAVANRLAPILGDWRMDLLTDVLAKPTIDRIVARLDVEAADAYTEGNYLEASAMIASSIECNPGQTNFYGLLARACLRSGERPKLPPKIGELIGHVISVYTFAENDKEATSALLREAVSGVHRSLASFIRALFSSFRDDPILTNIHSGIEALNCTRLSPLQLRSLPVSERGPLLDAAVAAFPMSTSLALQQSVCRFGERELDPQLIARLPDDRALLYQARALLRLSRIDDAIPILKKLEDDSVAPVAIDAKRELFKAYSTAGQVKEALRVVARAHLSNEKLHAIFKIEPLLDSIEGTEQAPFDQIALAICYHIYNRFASNPRFGNQADAAEEYASSRGAATPSKIEFKLSDEDFDLFAIYLDQVCSSSILDKFMAIDDLNGVELERLEICRILSEMDASNRQRYLDEIREITRRRVVRERFEQVERTKIYVDTEGVKRQAEKTLRDAYVRFIAALADTSQGNERLEMMRHVQSIIAGVKTDGVKIHFRDLPASERDQLFDRIVGDLMRMLISSQEYGLEAYLSTRVRHGTMGNQLRSAFEVNSLLTQKDGGRYQPDEAWAERLDLGDDPRGRWLSSRLAVFSEEIDSTIEHLVRKRVQVRSELASEGLFVFHAYNYDTLRLQSEITPETSFDTFMERVIEQFWGVLEDSLHNVRKYIESSFLQEVIALTATLQVDLTRELSGVNFSHLSSAIEAARTQMVVNVANVASWFTLARDMERPDYEFDIAVEVATKSIRACHPSLGITLDKSDCVSFDCRGRTLESVVYVLFTALDNAIEHSGFNEHAPNLTLEAKLGEGWLELTLKNSCIAIGDVAVANARLSELRARLENAADLRSLATTEGGSGYAKIIRILRHDLLARYSLDFGYCSATEYAVRIGIEEKAIVK